RTISALLNMTRSKSFRHSASHRSRQPKCRAPRYPTERPSHTASAPVGSTHYRHSARYRRSTGRRRRRTHRLANSPRCPRRTPEGVPHQTPVRSVVVQTGPTRACGEYVARRASPDAMQVVERATVLQLPSGAVEVTDGASGSDREHVRGGASPSAPVRSRRQLLARPGKRIGRGVRRRGEREGRAVQTRHARAHGLRADDRAEDPNRHGVALRVSDGVCEDQAAGCSRPEHWHAGHAPAPAWFTARMLSGTGKVSSMMATWPFPRIKTRSVAASFPTESPQLPSRAVLSSIPAMDSRRRWVIR